MYTSEQLMKEMKYNKKRIPSYLNGDPEAEYYEQVFTLDKVQHTEQCYFGLNSLMCYVDDDVVGVTASVAQAYMLYLVQRYTKNTYALYPEVVEVLKEAFK